MRDKLLPAAGRLYQAETARLGEDSEDAEAWPWVAIATGLVALGTLGWAQRREFHRTNRVLNRGLLPATAASTVVMLWLVVGHAVDSTQLSSSGPNQVRNATINTPNSTVGPFGTLSFRRRISTACRAMTGSGS